MKMHDFLIKISCLKKLLYICKSLIFSLFNYISYNPNFSSQIIIRYLIKFFQIFKICEINDDQSPGNLLPKSELFLLIS